MKIIGLTGSIGMGKTTVAKMFESCGVPTHDADAAVHRLLQKDQAGYKAVAQIFPIATFPQIYDDQGVNRKALGALVFADAALREKLESVLHPLVREDQRAFIAAHKAEDVKAVVLDIPLLFETGGEKRVDVTVAVSAPPEVQRARVLARAGMSEEKFRAILSRQMPDSEKRKRADYVIDTGTTEAETLAQLRDILERIL